MGARQMFRSSLWMTLPGLQLLTSAALQRPSTLLSKQAVFVRVQFEINKTIGASLRHFYGPTCLKLL